MLKSIGDHLLGTGKRIRSDAQKASAGQNLSCIIDLAFPFLACSPERAETERLLQRAPETSVAQGHSRADAAR